MKRTKLIFGLLLFLFFSVMTVYSQDAVTVNQNGVQMFLIGDTCNGSGQLKYDDGSLANGGGWNNTVTDGRMVLKFTPLSYPWNFTKFCIALTRTGAGTANMTFDIVVYDTTGAGGAPGALIGTIPGQTATGLLVFPAYSWFSFPLAGIPALTGGSYYIGVKYSAVSQINQFVMFDEAPTLLRAGYGWANAGPWTAAATYWATYRSWGMRTEGSAPAVTGWCQGFTDVTFPPTGWTLTGAAALWSRNVVSGFGVGLGSAKADFYNVSAGGTQQLNSIVFGTPTASGDSLIFQNAYCTFATENDQLQIQTSTNGGTTWVPLVTLNGGVSGPLVTAPPQTASFTPTAAQWKYQRLALPVGVNRVQFNGISAFGNNLYIDSICYKPAIVGISNNNTVAKEFSLSQNYPNPFNPTTNIKFGLPTSGNVKLVVFDVLGREVTTLVNEFKTSGIYTVDFDASMLSSGVYFYRIDAGNFTQTKKMLLVK